MNLDIRPFTPEDYPAVTAIVNAAYAEYPRSVEELRFQDEHRDPKCKFQRWVAQGEGQVLACGEYNQTASMYHPRKFWLDVAVQPDRRRQGIGARLYDHVMAALQPFDPLAVRAGVREDMTHSLQFLKRRAFQEDMRSWESRLDVAAFDFAPYAGAEERARAQGIEIKSFAELAADPDRNRKVYELTMEVERDVPSPDPHTDVSYEFFVERRLNDPNLLPDAFFVALHDDKYVGTSALWASQGNDDLYTGLTGIRRDYRRKGIALALKLRGIAYARAHGRSLIKTWNESRNRPMLSINEALGYVKQPAWIFFVKVLKEES